MFCCLEMPRQSKVWTYDELKDKAALTGMPYGMKRNEDLWSPISPDASSLTPGYKYHRKLVDVQWLPRDIYKIYQWKGWKLVGIESANMSDVESDVWAIFEVPINTPDKEL